MDTYMKIGGFKYYTFGLRQEWLWSLLANEKNFFKESSLGPRQMNAFMYYLKDTELLDTDKNLTALFNCLKTLYFKDGPYSQILWGVMWVNLCFNVPIFKWWSTLSTCDYSMKDLANKLAPSYGKENKYLKSGLSSIKETLSKSPIGVVFGQGIPIKKVKVIKGFKKIGIERLHPVLILYSLYKYAEKKNIYEMDLFALEDELYSPQRIFTISTVDLERSLLDDPEFSNLYKLSFERPHFVFLYSSLKPLNILEQYIGGLNK